MTQDNIDNFIDFLEKERIEKERVTCKCCGHRKDGYLGDYPSTFPKVIC